MSHDAPVNTVPTQSAGSLQPVPAVTVVFDVGNLERTEKFYSSLLGFRVVRTERAGLPYETLVMTSDRYPGVALFARKTFQRPVAGSTIGGVLQIGLHDPDLPRTVAQLDGQVTWAVPPGAEQPQRPEVTRVSLIDPDGYIIELFR